MMWSVVMWYDMIWYDMDGWYDMIWCEKIWENTIEYDET